MRQGFSLGRVFGIAIVIDWSWLFIFVLVTWNLAATFPTLHPGWGLGPSLALAVVAALLFFGSVLLHEVAHALVARTQGVPVRNITLFLFGGVSNIQREPPSPRAELLITVVGPATSLLLGVAFLALGALGAGGASAAVADPARFYARLDPATTVLLWLGPLNLALGVFNLLPGFPLDGGRVLRALLWAATGELRRATRWATAVSHAIAWILILGGVAAVFGADLPFFGAGVLSGLWLAFIGWFLHSAATQSYQQVVVQDLLAGVPVARLLRPAAPVTVAPGCSVAALVQDYLLGTDERAFPVLDGDRLVGLVALDDVRRAPRATWAATPVSRIMTPLERLVVATPQEDADEAFAALTGREVEQLPVVQEGRLVGLLRRRDILRWLQMQEARPAA